MRNPLQRVRRGVRRELPLSQVFGIEDGVQSMGMLKMMITYTEYSEETGILQAYFSVQFNF